MSVLGFRLKGDLTNYLNRVHKEFYDIHMLTFDAEITVGSALPYSIATNMVNSIIYQNAVIFIVMMFSTSRLL